jgi:hypothetical protein
VDSFTHRGSKSLNPTQREMRVHPQPAETNVATLAVASLATALVLIIFTVPLTTLTSTAQALGATPGSQAWILSAMSMGAAAALLGSGVIGDDYGRRRTFVAGAIVDLIQSRRQNWADRDGRLRAQPPRYPSHAQARGPDRHVLSSPVRRREWPHRQDPARSGQ